MFRMFFGLILAILSTLVLAEDELGLPEIPAQEAPAISSRFLEKELQSLNWERFQVVVRAVPKLRAQVDAYGPLGWQYVQLNYQTYGWRKSIDKLDEGQKRELQVLIAKARAMGAP